METVLKDGNCFAEETKFLTIQGLQSFHDFNDGDEVTVFDQNGDLKRAVVNRFKPQPMRRVKMILEEEHDIIETEIICTKDHQWVLKDGKRTNDLRIGQQVQGFKMASPIWIDKSKPVLWVVVSIAVYKDNKELPAWCITQKETSSFILESGIVSGNCAPIE